MRSYLLGELESLRWNMLSMGELTLESIAHSLRCLMKTEGATYERATELESRIDDWNRSVHDQSLTILTLQSPVAADARLVSGILESIVDLEQIGDYAYEIAELAVRTGRRPISQLFTQVVGLGEGVREMLRSALDSWRHLDRAQGLSVRPREAFIRSDCQILIEKLYQLVTSARDGQIYVSLILICKHLGRMARHIVNVAEQAAAAAPADR
jgi:phosphate transport system protein